MKFAVVMSASWDYRYGLNAVLNGLDYHNNNVSDVHILDLSRNIPQWYYNTAKEVFDFNIHIHFLDEYMEKYPDRPSFADSFWTTYHYKYLLASDLASQYDVMMIMDIDYLVCGKLDNYVKAVFGTDLILVPNLSPKPAEWHSHINGANIDDLRDMLEKDVHFVSTANSPFIVDCKKNSMLYTKTYECGFNTGNDMWSLFQAIVALDKADDVIDLPGVLWYNPAWRHSPIESHMVSGKRCYFTLGEKMMMIHRRWWAYDEQHSWCSGLAAKDDRVMCHKNVNILLLECKLINTEWKLPLKWDISKWRNPDGKDY